MHDKWQWLLWGGPVVAFVLYVCWIVLSSWLEVKAAPRAEMFFCQLHGMLKREHCIEFMGVPYCPTCFHGRLKDAGAAGR